MIFHAKLISDFCNFPLFLSIFKPKHLAKYVFPYSATRVTDTGDSAHCSTHFVAAEPDEGDPA